MIFCSACPRRGYDLGIQVWLHLDEHYGPEYCDYVEFDASGTCLCMHPGKVEFVEARNEHRMRYDSLLQPDGSILEEHFPTLASIRPSAFTVTPNGQFVCTIDGVAQDIGNWR